MELLREGAATRPGLEDSEGPDPRCGAYRDRAVESRAGDAGCGRLVVWTTATCTSRQRIRSMPAEEIESPVFELSHLTWEQVADFLWYGRSYE
jgi:hypothetical protein